MRWNGVVDAFCLALEIERQPHALVGLAGVHLKRLADVPIDRALLGAVEYRRAGGIALEVERFGKFAVARIGQGVGETLRVVDPFRQHLAHEGFGVVHVLETERLHRILEYAIVPDEVVNGFDARDVGEIVGAVALHIRLARRALERRREIRRNELVADGGAEHFCAFLAKRFRNSNARRTCSKLACAAAGPLQPRARHSPHRGPSIRTHPMRAQ
jgi:hypothetical protein